MFGIHSTLYSFILDLYYEWGNARVVGIELK